MNAVEVFIFNKSLLRIVSSFRLCIAVASLSYLPILFCREYSVFLFGFRPFLEAGMARVRASVMVAATAAMAATGASLSYVYFTGPPEPSPHPPPQPISLPPLPASTRHFSPPPDLPLSSKLPVIPDSNFDDLEPEDAASECDYGPLWECIVNGNGGCEVLEEDLRNCLERSKKTRRS